MTETDPSLIHEARRALGIASNGALAERLGCDRATLDAYAKGRKPVPRYIVLAIRALIHDAKAPETRAEPR